MTTGTPARARRRPARSQRAGAADDRDGERATRRGRTGGLQGLFAVRGSPDRLGRACGSREASRRDRGGQRHRGRDGPPAGRRGRPRRRDRRGRRHRAGGGGELDGAAYELDVRSTASIAVAVEAAERDLGPLDVLVNNAGYDEFGFFTRTDEEMWDRVLAVNLRGTIAVSHAVLSGMQERRRGRIVNVASEAGRVGSQGSAVYSAAKAGVIGFTKTLAREAARYEVTANAIAPGPIETPLLMAAPEALGEVGQRLVDGMVGATRCADSAGPTRSPRQSPSWRPTTLPTSPARRSGSAAASGCSERGRRRRGRPHPRGRAARRVPERARDDRHRRQGPADRDARRTGLRRLEVTSFVRADVVPQLADARRGARGASPLPPRSRLGARAQRARARERARPAHRVDGRAHRRGQPVPLGHRDPQPRNVNRSVEESLAGLERSSAVHAGRGCAARASSPSPSAAPTRARCPSSASSASPSAWPPRAAERSRSETRRAWPIRARCASSSRRRGSGCRGWS